MMLMTIWLLVLAAVSWLYLRRIYSRFSSYGVKHFTPIPLLGNMTRIILRLDHFEVFVNKMYDSFPNERFIGIYELMNPVVLIRDLELIKKVTVKDFEYFVDHRTLIDENVDPFIGKSLFSLKGQKWKDMRSALSPAFTGLKIRLMVPFMIEIGEQMITAIKQKIKASGNDCVEIDSKDLLTRYTNDVIALCAFGIKVDSQTKENNEFYKMARAASEFSFSQILKLAGHAIFPSFMRLLKIQILSKSSKNFFRHLVLNTMRDRETNHIKKNDMIHLLMEAKKGQLKHENHLSKDIDTGFATVEESVVGKRQIDRVWTEDDLIAQAVQFFIAGFETVSTVMAFLLYELAVNPDVQNKLAQEIKSDWKKNDGRITFESIQKMIYMDMVVSEVLRLWPPAIATNRLCTKDYNLGKCNDSAAQDYIIRKGEGIGIVIWAIHRSPGHFPDPNKFDPERFSEVNKPYIRPYTYMPFGLGPRNCIGSRFALCEIKIVLYLLILQMEISPTKGTKIPAKLTYNSFNLRLEGGHWLRFRNRD